MQKLVILDGSTGVCHILPISDESAENLDEYVDGLGFVLGECQYMVALEINDKTK